MNIQFHKHAEIDLNIAAGSYSSEHSARFTNEYAELLAALTERPRSFARLETYRGKREIRRCIFAKYPYVLIFEIISPNELKIIAIVHTSRRPNSWRSRL